MVKTVLLPRCNYCSSSESPNSRCSSCKVARYCNQEHQLADWYSHKSVCSTIKRYRIKLEKEELNLRTFPGGSWAVQNIFEDPGSIGHFWRIFETRDYMKARVDYVIQSLRIDSHDVVSGALDHLLDMLRLCRSDNLGVRDMVPNLYLRLNQDQKCYDFIKWYATDGEADDYDWGDMNLPFLNLENEDAIESVELFRDEWSPVSRGIPITLIKVRMLLDLRDVRASSALHGIGQLNFDAVHHIQDSLDFRSSILTARHELLSREGLDGRIKVLEEQADEMFAVVHKGNKWVWEAILRPSRYAHMSPGAYSRGSIEETVILLLNNGKSWAETDGALDWIKGKLA